MLFYSGYQRELRYKRNSGSYSAFGNSDDAGSMMYGYLMWFFNGNGVIFIHIFLIQYFPYRLTAFVVRSYARARKYIFVDDNEIKDSVKWFESKQKKNGCFPQHGRLFHRGLQVIKTLQMMYIRDTPCKQKKCLCFLGWC